MFSGKHILYTTEVCCILTGIVVFVAAFFAMNKGYVEVSKVSTILDMIFRKEGKARLEINTHMEAFSTMIFSAIKYLENFRHSPIIIYLNLCTQLSLCVTHVPINITAIITKPMAKPISIWDDLLKIMFDQLLPKKSLPVSFVPDDTLYNLQASNFADIRI